MRTFMKFAAIPLLLFLIFFCIPKLFQVLVNSHTDTGIAILVVLACGIFGTIASKIYSFVSTHIKED